MEQSQIQRVGDAAGHHCGAQLPLDDVAGITVSAAHRLASTPSDAGIPDRRGNHRSAPVLDCRPVLTAWPDFIPVLHLSRKPLAPDPHPPQLTLAKAGCGEACRLSVARRTTALSQGQAFRSSSSVIMPLIASRPIFAVHRQISYSSFLPLIHVQMRHRDVAPLLLGHQKKRTR